MRIVIRLILMPLIFTLSVVASIIFILAAVIKWVISGETQTTTITVGENNWGL
jgi:hypothetical protein